MSTYIVRVEVITDALYTFVNLHPILKVDTEGTLSEVSQNEFMPYGTINVYGAQSYKGSGSQYLVNGAYCQVELSDSDVKRIKDNMDLKNGRPKPQIHVTEYIERCNSVTTSAISEVIQLPKQYNISKYHEWKDSYLLNILPPLVKSVYLEDSECIAGPFTWNLSQDNRYNFVIDVQDNLNQDKYLIPYYDKLSFNKILHYLDDSGNESQQMRQIFSLQSLPEKIDSIDCIDDDKLKKIVIDYLSQNAYNQDISKLEAIIGSLPSEIFTVSRQNRILGLLKNRKFLDQIINLIPPLLMKEEGYKDALVSAICENVDYFESLLPKIEEYEMYRERLERLKSEISKKQKMRDEIDSQIEGQTLISSEKVVELEGIILEKDDIIVRQTGEIEHYKKLEATHMMYEELLDEVSRLEGTKRDLYKTIAEISTDIKKEVSKAYANLAIDGAISSMMLHEAAEFERKANQKKIQDSISTLESVEKISTIKTASELVDFIKEELESVNRYVSKNDIANILICVSQGFLTVLAGEPGCGKTSLVSLLAQILGLSNYQNPRYQEIAVEKGWTSRRDLIGYYNPLTKSFEAANKGMFSALAISEEECDKGVSAFPYWILLDEANLSQMEHYWADFMGVCDLNKNVRQISLNEDYVFRINPTLRFLATINLDHTTEVLSPRLIDRAWIIKLKAANVDIDKPLGCRLDKEYPMVEYSVFEQLGSPDMTTQKLKPGIVDKFNRIQAIFAGKVGIEFSPRVIEMIRRYCLASTDLLDTSTNSYAALDYAIAQKILPMIDGYGQKYQTLVEELIKVCDYNSMPICNHILLEIQEKGENNMQYYQFFAR